MLGTPNTIISRRFRLYTPFDVHLQCNVQAWDKSNVSPRNTCNIFGTAVLLCISDTTLLDAITMPKNSLSMLAPASQSLSRALVQDRPWFHLSCLVRQSQGIPHDIHFTSNLLYPLLSARPSFAAAPSSRRPCHPEWLARSDWPARASILLGRSLPFPSCLLCGVRFLWLGLRCGCGLHSIPVVLKTCGTLPVIGKEELFRPPAER